MNFSERFLNTISGKQKLLEGVVLGIIFIAVGFSFGDKNVKWFWNDYPFMAMLLVLIGLLLALLWIRIEKRKTQIIINEIKNANRNDAAGVYEQINSLTGRQREIFDLILQGKSNKEIMGTLVIELSTLKTHINHIYKTLKINNRKEAKAIGKSYKIDQT